MFESLGWNEVLKNELKKPYFEKLRCFVKAERERAAVFPPKEQVFSALSLTPLENTRVVIVGQDPYHGRGQAHGLCFSVQKGIPFPPSLLNIFKELESDIGLLMPKHGCLESWAKQGVLLLNTTLTVVENTPLSHFGQGWELFTDAVIEAVSRKKEPVIFVLWGKNAQDKCKGIAAGFHTVLKAPHPSPLSAHRGFFGSKPFSKINAVLKERGESIIDWRI